MATKSNLPAKMYKAGERTERTLRFIFASGTGVTKHISIGAALSMINRRFYREGLYYYVSNAYVVNTGGCKVQLATLPDTYATKLAWVRGYKQWQKQAREAAQDGNMNPAKYRDFKVSMTSNDTMITPGYGQPGASHNYTQDERVMSKFILPDGSSDGDEALVHMLGPHSGSYTSIGLLRSLNDVWKYPATPDVDIDADHDTDPIALLFDYDDNLDDVRLDTTGDNDLAPYNNDTLPGASASDETSEVAAFASATAGSEPVGRHLNGFCVPFGMIEVRTDGFAPDGSSEDSGNIELVLEITPGPYHGVYAERAL